MSLGATPDRAAPAGSGAWRFTVWAPFARLVEVALVDRDEVLALEPGADGDHQGVAQGLAPADRYLVRVDRGPWRPDPASRSQPEGVHGPSALVDPGAFRWTDGAWSGLALADHVLYELHVGTFSASGDFDGVVEHLTTLRDLGITAVELMPVAQFPGTRNWGYDGVALFAVQHSYGGAAGLARLVDAAHRLGLAVVVDVVYNHLGPEGNYLSQFGPYFTDEYRTPWGPALNFSGPHNGGVRRHFVESAEWLVRDLHVDGLRVDAVHAIVDPSPTPFVEELCATLHALGAAAGRSVTVVAESAANDPRTVRPPAAGGWGFDGQWNDDVHHAIHVAVTGERDGYYEDYIGVPDLAHAMTHGYVLDGRWSPFRHRVHGRSAEGIEPWRFVAFAQNHDQVGNRMLGERLTTLAGFEARKAAAALVLCGPFTPLLFMGEEYGETAPFPYFVDHGDPDLLAAVRRGRAEEFARFAWRGEPPDPGDPATFASARLDHRLRDREPHATTWRLHQHLVRLRREVPALAPDAEVVARAEAATVVVERTAGPARSILAVNLSDHPHCLTLPAGSWTLALSTADAEWDGPGAGPTTDARHEVAPWSASLLV